MPLTTDVERDGTRWTVSSLIGIERELLETIAFEEHPGDRQVYVSSPDTYRRGHGKRAHNAAVERFRAARADALTHHATI